MKGVVVSLLLSFVSHTLVSQPKSKPISALKFIGQYEIPFNKNFKNTIVGGLSGIDFDAKRNLYYLICDDRSAKNDARFYTAKIHLGANGIDSVQLIGVTTLLQPNGQPYPSAKQNAKLTPDPESIRYNSSTNELIWSSEGERIISSKDTILQNPSIQSSGIDGKYKSSFVMPTILQMQTKEVGPRQNGAFEGISFTNDYSTLYACLEEPLYQDGPKADVEETKSYVRIFKFDTKSGSNTAQFAYALEKVAYPSNPTKAFKVNGVSEILAIEQNQLLVVERSFSTGRLPCTVKLFLTDLANAENIIGNDSLTKNPSKRMASKRLLLNMDDLDIFIDNIEGITFGPTLANGNRTLLFVADNNFQRFEKNQFLLFEVVP